MKQEMVQQRSQPRALTLNFMTGATLLVVGLILMIFKIGVLSINNWWSLFIFLLALGFLGMGFRLKRDNGRFPLVARLCIGLGAVVLTTGMMFLLDVDWTRWWPLMVTVPGAALYLAGCSRGVASANTAALAGMVRWCGVTAVLLGLTFLLDQLTIINLEDLFGDFHWWGFFILLPGIGAFVETIRSLRRGASATAAWLMIGTVWIVGASIQECTGLDWDLWQGVVGVGLIASGSILLLARIRP